MGRSWSTTQKAAVAGVLASGVLAAGGLGVAAAVLHRRAAARPPTAPPRPPAAPPAPPEPARPLAGPPAGVDPEVNWSRVLRNGGLRSQSCDRSAGEVPAAQRTAYGVRILPDKVIKFVQANRAGQHELVASQLYERHGLGPRVLDAYFCTGSNLLAIEYERLDGTLGDLYARYQRGDPKKLVRPLEGVLDLLRRCQAVGLSHGDVHQGNFMYKILPDGSLKWYVIDHATAQVDGGPASRTSAGPDEVYLRMHLWFFRRGIDPGKFVEEEHLTNGQIFDRIPPDARREAAGLITMNNARAFRPPAPARLTRQQSAGPAPSSETTHPELARIQLRSTRPRGHAFY